MHKNILFSVAHDIDDWFTEDTPTQVQVDCGFFCATDIPCTSDSDSDAAMLSHSDSFTDGCLKKAQKTETYRALCEKIDPSLSTRYLEEEPDED